MKIKTKKLYKCENVYESPSIPIKDSYTKKQVGVMKIYYKRRLKSVPKKGPGRICQAWIAINGKPSGIAMIANPIWAHIAKLYSQDGRVRKPIRH